MRLIRYLRRYRHSTAIASLPALERRDAFYLAFQQLVCCPGRGARMETRNSVYQDRKYDRQSDVDLWNIFDCFDAALTRLLTFMQSFVFGARLFLVFTAYWPSFQTVAPYRGRLQVRRVRRCLQSKSRARLRDLSCIVRSSPFPYPRLLHPSRRFRYFS